MIGVVVRIAEHARDTRLSNSSLIPLVQAGRGKEIEEIITRFDKDPNQADSTGMTPLIAAVKDDRANMVLLLRRLGADPLVRDGDGKSALDWAMGENNWDCYYALTLPINETTNDNTK